MPYKRPFAHRIARLVMGLVFITVAVNTLINSTLTYHKVTTQVHKEIELLAKATAFNLASAGEFSDADAATKILEALRVDDKITAAEFTLADGRRLANYGEKIAAIPGRTVITTVAWNDEHIGELVLNYTLTQEHNTLVHSLFLTLLLLLFILMVAGYCALRFTRTLTGPLYELTATAERVEQQGDISLRAPISQTDDEIAQLAIQFNAMMERIQQQENNLLSYHETLEQKVKARTHELREQTLKAEAANTAKSDFLAVMSHEIRTPINGILGMNSLLLNSSLNQIQHRYAQTAMRSAENLLAIINDILDFSKIEAGKLELDESGFNLNQLLEELIDRYSSIAQSKNVELLCATLIPPLVVEGDALRLGQVITNLLSNAIKFTHAGEVVLRVNQVAHTLDRITLNFSVQDSGIGLTDEQMKKLFNAFCQGDSGTARKFGGTGLGLAISQRIVNQMGGGISVKSQLGVGSRFEFTLEFKTIAIFPYADLSQYTRELNLVVVDDNPTNLSIIKTWLTHWQVPAWYGVNVALARQYIESLPESQKVDAIFTYWPMPDQPAVALVEWLLAHPQRAQTPIYICCSAGLPSFMALRATQKTLSKPVKQGEIYQILLSLIGETDTTNSIPGRLFPANANNQAGLSKRFVGQVLLVEDNLVNQEVAIAMLRQLGVSPRLAMHGEEATQLFKQHKFDLILMDCQMPILDGFEVTRLIRDYESASGVQPTPVVALTANAIVGDREYCLSKGMNDYLSKPFDMEQLAATLSRWLPEHEFSPQAIFPARMLPKLDKKILASIRGIEPLLLGKIVSLFEKSAPELMKQMDAAFNQRQSEELFKVSHTLKNSAANLGFKELADVCRTIELLGRDNRLDEAEPYLAQLYPMHCDYLSLMQQYLKEYPHA